MFTAAVVRSDGTRMNPLCRNLGTGKTVIEQGDRFEGAYPLCWQMLFFSVECAMYANGLTNQSPIYLIYRIHIVYAGPGSYFAGTRLARWMAISLASS